jgi:hypothetical protein
MQHDILGMAIINLREGFGDVFHPAQAETGKLLRMSEINSILGSMKRKNIVQKFSTYTYNIYGK